jgi:hypothetical protein
MRTRTQRVSHSDVAAPHGSPWGVRLRISLISSNSTPCRLSRPCRVLDDGAPPRVLRSNHLLQRVTPMWAGSPTWSARSARPRFAHTDRAFGEACRYAVKYVHGVQCFFAWAARNLDGEITNLELIYISWPGKPTASIGQETVREERPCVLGSLRCAASSATSSARAAYGS